MKEEYNLKDYVLTIENAILRGHEHEEYVTVRAKTDPAMSRGSEHFILQCRTTTFENFMACLGEGAGKIELSGYLTSPGIYTRVSIYSEITENLIGTFSMNKIILEHRKSTAYREEIRNIRYLLYTLYQIQKRYDLKVDGAKCAFIPNNVPDNLISFKKFEHQLLPSGEYVIDEEVMAAITTSTDQYNAASQSTHKYEKRDERMNPYDPQKYKITVRHHENINTDNVIIYPIESTPQELMRGFYLACHLDVFQKLLVSLDTAQRIELYNYNKLGEQFRGIKVYDNISQVIQEPIDSFDVTGVVLEGEINSLDNRQEVIKLYRLLSTLMQTYDQLNLPINPRYGGMKMKGIKFDYNLEQYDLVIDVLPNTADKVVHIRVNETKDMGEGDVQFSLSCYLRTFNEIVTHLMTASKLELHELEKEDGVYNCITIYDINTEESTDFHVMGATLEENTTIAEGDNLNKIFLLVRNLLKEYRDVHPENKRIYSGEAIAKAIQQGQLKLEELKEKGVIFTENGKHPK